MYKHHFYSYKFIHNNNNDLKSKFIIKALTQNTKQLAIVISKISYTHNHFLCKYK